MVSRGTSTPLSGTNARPQLALCVQDAPAFKPGDRACDAARRWRPDGRWDMHVHSALWALTFDMSGDRETAQLALGRPLDGGVRCLSAEHDLDSGSRRARAPLARAYSPAHARTAARRCGKPQGRACGTHICCLGHGAETRAVNNACRQQRLRARHGQPAESTAGKEALWRVEQHWR